MTTREELLAEFRAKLNLLRVLWDVPVSFDKAFPEEWLADAFNRVERATWEKANDAIDENTVEKTDAFYEKLYQCRVDRKSIKDAALRDGYDLSQTVEESPELCSTCGGLGTVPVLEHHSGPNLPPGGFDDVGDETQPCPDCKLS